MEKPDFLTRIILFLIFLVALLRTFDKDKARVVKALAEEVFQGSITTESSKLTTDSSKSTTFRLSDDLKEYIVRNVRYKNYKYIRRKLEKLGYTNVRIRKRMNLIIIECDQGKDVIVLND